MNNEKMNLTKVIVPCRFSYLHCWEPNAVNVGWVWKPWGCLPEMCWW